MGPVASSLRWGSRGVSRVDFETACQLGQQDVVLNYRGDVNAPFERGGKSPIAIAAGFGRVEVVKALASKGAHLDRSKQSIGILQKCSPLHLATESNHFQTVRVLVGELGVDVDCTWRGRTPLASCRTVEMMRLLISEFNADTAQVGRLLEPGGPSDMMGHTGPQPMAHTIAALAWEAGYEFDAPRVASITGLCKEIENVVHHCGPDCPDRRTRMRSTDEWVLSRGFPL